jgi:hypothetical protein
MISELIKFNFIEKSSKIITDVPMVSFCCFKDQIYYSHSKGIGSIIDGEVDNNWHEELCSVSPPDLTTISSIASCEPLNNLYVVCNGGSQIGRIDLNMLDFDFLISNGSAVKFQKKFLSTTTSETYVSASSTEIVWSVKGCHRCFKIHNSSAIPLVGNGKAGYSLSKNENSRICSPTGITHMNGTVCFADSGNNCLRGIKGNFTFNVIDDCKGLGTIHYVNEKLFFLSGNIIFMLSSEGDSTHFYEVYESEHPIRSFYPSGKDSIYILVDNGNKIKKGIHKSD